MLIAPPQINCKANAEWGR